MAWSNDPGSSQAANQQSVDIQTRYQEEALRKYLAYMQQALAANQQQTQNAAGAQIGATQMGDTATRQMLQAGQAASRPYDMAGLSLLQALPGLQQMVGVPSYEMPKTLSQYDFVGNAPNIGAELKKGNQVAQDVYPAITPALADLVQQVPNQPRTGLPKGQLPSNPEPYFNPGVGAIGFPLTFSR
jgi:hypothetical protein